MNSSRLLLLRFPARLVVRIAGAALALVIALSAGHPASAASPAPVPLDYYLPVASANYDPAIPTPQQTLGFQIGEWHLHHHELVDYLRKLAAASDRVKLVEYARSHGRRPLIQLIITAPRNQAKLEPIRQAHVARLTSPGAPAGAGDGPIVVWLGYSVHGNEPSGANSAALVAYHLAAARDDATLAWLKDAVILLDPCLNPDGFERFANWSNNHRGRHPSPHRQDREHAEAWPTGRPNYYWFDLNRDWLPAVHPESRGRLRVFHEWQPNIVTDVHEMGNANRTYFFQPGFSKMVHPLTPPENQKLTAAMAAEHARALDAIRALYYTGESYDDYYLGKGSTYPDLNGSVGVLFEQASSRGYHQDTEHGRLTFPFTIRNQLLTSLSTLRTAHRLRPDFLDYQSRFYRDALREAGEARAQAHVFSAPGDPARLQAFRDLLALHQIESHRPAADVRSGTNTFGAADSLVVPVRQRQFRLLTALFETRTNFPSAIFYDVSAWHLPSAFGLLHAELRNVPPAAPGQAPGALANPVRVQGAEDAYAYVFPWEPRQAPRALFRLLEAKVRCWTATKPFTTRVDDKPRTWAPGSIIIPAGSQEALAPGALRELMQAIAKDHALEVHPLATGYHGSMPDLGSPSFLPVTHRGALLVTGPGVDFVTAGAVWHQFDQVWQTPLTKVEAAQLHPGTLEGHSTVILADTPFAQLPEGAQASLQDWVARGGTLIAIGTTVRTLATQAWCKVELAGATGPDSPSPAAASAQGSAPTAPALKPSPGKDTNAAPGAAGKDAKPAANASIETTNATTVTTPKAAAKRPAYGDAEERRAERNLDGIVVRASYDATHPLAFGFGGRPFIELMRDGTTFLKPSANPYLNPLHYTEDPLVSGYASKANLDLMKDTTPVQMRPVASGRVIFLTDNPVFRGHWLGSEKLLANAIFFGPLVKSAGAGGAQAESAEDH